MLYDAFVQHLHTDTGETVRRSAAEIQQQQQQQHQSLSAASAATRTGNNHEAAADPGDETNASMAAAMSPLAAAANQPLGASSAVTANAAAAAAAAELADAAAKFVDRSDHEYHEYNILKLRVNFVYANEANDAMAANFVRWQREAADPMQTAPSAIVAGCTHGGLFRGNLSDETLQRYGANLTRLLPAIGDLLAGRTKVLWKLQDDVDEEDAQLPDEWRAVPNADMQRYNEVAHDIMTYAGVPVWSSGRRIAAGLVTDNVAGWRLSALALRHDVQLLLNMYCNDNMNYNDGSCCSSAEPYTMLQIVTYAVLAVWYVYELV